MRNKTIISLAFVSGFTLGMALEIGCQPSVEEQCLLLDPSRDFQGPPAQREICGWMPGILPEPAQGYAKTHLISVGFTTTEDEPCDSCDLERFEELLREEVERRCGSLDYTDLTLGCYIPPDENSDSCWITGYYSSNYDNVPIEHGCSPL